MIIYSHRGLDFDRREELAENSLVSFQRALQAGFGVELDLQQLGSGELVVWHDADLTRWTASEHVDQWSSVTASELTELEQRYGELCRFEQVLDLAQRSPALQLAVHIKAGNQHERFMLALVRALQVFPSTLPRLLFFDLVPEWAGWLRSQVANVQVAASVAHAFDIQRFQTVTGGTLLTLDEVIEAGAYTWAWIDEWDLLAGDGKTKELPEQIIPYLRDAGLRCAVISPELHRQEGHPDGLEVARMEGRWRRWLKLKPDAICTDYPARLFWLARSG